MRDKSEQVNNYGAVAEAWLNRYCGKFTGIFDKVNIFYDKGILAKDFHLIAPRVPMYTKDIYGPEYAIDFHLAGFSTNRKDAFLRAVGESIERYSHLTSEIKFREKFICSSYHDLSMKGYRVCPLCYINVFKNEQLENFSLKEFERHHITEYDEIEWLMCKSIYDDSPILIPAQMFFLITKNENERRFYMSVSTGTAAHTSFKNALKSAIIEYLQVDSMVMSWYVLGRLRPIRGESPVLNELINRVGIRKEYDILFYDITLDKPIPVIACIIINKRKKYPYCTFGMQADEKVEKAMFRSFMEAYANIGSRLASNELKSNKEEFLRLKEKVEKNVIYNINDNVDFFLSEYAGDDINNILTKLVRGAEIKTVEELKEKESKVMLEELIEFLRPISSYACYLDITSDEFLDDGWYVVRTIIPELLPLCMPSMPFENHPRIKNNGGIRNRFIHPSP